MKCKAYPCVIVIIALVAIFLPKISAFAASEDVVAVAASMHECTLELAAAFEEADFGEAPRLVSGASGKLAAQITAGAPFCLFYPQVPNGRRN